jgi:hydrogenase nickel incorporation protein HypA/HybF
MHELSLACHVVELVADSVRAAGGGRVAAVRLRVGALACVHEDSLRYGFDLVREGTPLAAVRLDIETVPVRIWCAECRTEFDLPGIQRCACPACGHLSGDIRAGRELELVAIEFAAPETPEAVA